MHKIRAQALRLICKDVEVSDQEFALQELCLQTDVCKPLLQPSSIRDNHLSRAFD